MTDVFWNSATNFVASADYGRAFLPVRVAGAAPDGSLDQFAQVALPSAGANGKSSYQIWLDQGHTGTEADFLASLAGAVTSDTITSALGYTPYSASNPSGYVTSAGARSAIGASGALGYDPASGTVSLTDAAIRARISGSTTVTYTSATGAITLTLANVKTALGYTPMDVAGGTFSGPVKYGDDYFSFQLSGGNPFISLANNTSYLTYLRSANQLEFVIGGSRVFAGNAGGLVVDNNLTVGGNVTVAAGKSLYFANGSVNHNGDQSISVNPIGNPAQTTLTSRLLQHTSLAGNATQREFVDYIGVNFNTGYDANDATRAQHDKVAQYVGAVILTGAADSWAINHLVTIYSSNAINVHANETDINNLSSIHYGDAVGGLGFSGPNARGLAVSGAGDHRVSTAFLAAFNGAGANRGFTAYVGCIQSGFEEDSAAQVAFRDCGSHVDGLNTEGALYSGSAVMLRNGHRMDARAANGTDRITIAATDSSNNLFIGTTGSSTQKVAAVFTGGNTAPVADNALTLGTPSNRWSSIYAANGTIQTSDPNLKTDIEPIDGEVARKIVMAIEPITFRWKEGGHEPVTVPKTRMVQATREEQVEQSYIEIVDGVALARTGTVAAAVPIFDEFPVIDPTTGKQVITVIPAQKARYNEDGEMISAARPEERIPRVHSEPRMVEEAYEEIEYEVREGRRTHWGWNAANVKEAYDAAGKDFGGYVEADGIRRLRPDQQVPALWAHVQFLERRLAALEGKA